MNASAVHGSWQKEIAIVVQKFVPPGKVELFYDYTLDPDRMNIFIKLAWNTQKVTIT